MAIIQSDAAKGKQVIPYPPYAGLTAVQKVSISVPSTLSTGDILEVGILPALSHLVDLVLATDNVGFTADVGLMTDEVGSPDLARTCDDVFFAGLNLTAGIKHLTKPSALTVGSSDRDRSIGIVMTGGSPTAGEITLIATYTAV